jgi:hypothetical protein
MNPRAHDATRKAGRRRDEALSHPVVRDVVEWAGLRRRDDPAAGAAAALVAIGELAGITDLGEAATAIVRAIDSAPSVRLTWQHRRRGEFLADPDRLVDEEAEPQDTENPLLSVVVRELLRLARPEPAEAIVVRIEGAVVQAGDWWARHSVPVPTSLDGPRLPGVMPAQSLRDSERISAHVSDMQLLQLVAGPHPGRGRPSQVAWRRGLTFWTAALLLEPKVLRPPCEAIRWWRSQLLSICCQTREAGRPSDGATEVAVG